MKKVLLAVVILVGLSTVANAQTSKGTWLLGGGASFQNQGDWSAWSFSPSIGGFIKDNFAIGAEVSLAGDKNYEGTSSTIAAYIKPYFGGNDKNKWFAKGGVGVFKTQYMQDSKFAYGAGIGNASFLTSNIALEVSANYTKVADYQDGLFDLRVGFQIHFGGK